MHEGELQQAPDLNIIESTLETKLRNRFLPPAYLMHLEIVLHDEWYNILLQTVQNLYEFMPRTVAPLKEKCGPTSYCSVL
jgi:hypothetical protein